MDSEKSMNIRAREPRPSSGFRVFPSIWPLLFCLILIPGCAGLVSSAAGDFADDLKAAIYDNDDLATVREGAPAYLLMIDGLVRRNPDDVGLLMTAADLHSTYASVFVQDEARAQRLTDKGLDYALRAVCGHKPAVCPLRGGDFEAFQAKIDGLGPKDIPVFFSLGSAWAAWIQAHSEDMNAMAEIARVSSIMRRIIAIDETWRKGEAYLYLGVMSALIPPALGGKPEESRAYFEKADYLSGGKNLTAKLYYAQFYARLVFDRELHDRLLGEVIEAEPRTPGYTLSNIWAQERARELLADGEDYF